MKLKSILLCSLLLLPSLSGVSAQDITISQRDWTDFKNDLILLQNNNKKQLETLDKQKKELTTLKTQLTKSQTALTKAEESNNQLQKSLIESKKELKKLKPKTVNVGVGLVYYDSKVKPAISLSYHDVTVTGNKDYVGVFYNLL